MSYREIDEVRPKAKKPHRCTWCGQQIVIGDLYVRRRGSFEGDMQIDKMHPECDHACHTEALAEGGQFEFALYEHERPLNEVWSETG